MSQTCARSGAALRWSRKRDGQVQVARRNPETCAQSHGAIFGTGARTRHLARKARDVRRCSRASEARHLSGLRNCCAGLSRCEGGGEPCRTDPCGHEPEHRSDRHPDRPVDRQVGCAAFSSFRSFFALAGGLGPSMAPSDPVFISNAVRLVPPSADHLQSTAAFGRDTLWRLSQGARWFLGLAFTLNVTGWIHYGRVARGLGLSRATCDHAMQASLARLSPKAIIRSHFRPALTMVWGAYSRARPVGSRRSGFSPSACSRPRRNRA